MAKVMISLPDEMLRALDAHAHRRGTTRSGLLQDLAAHALAEERSTRDRTIERLLAAPTSRGGTAAADVRRDRSR
jgi:metal-responsive CopG/Arc/MetJ family transcriptional regulator